MTIEDDYDDTRYTTGPRNKTINDSRRRKQFVPLRDLLRKGHADRVQDYLDKMNGLSINEIENGRMGHGTDAKKNEDATIRQSTIGGPTPRQV